MKRRDLLALCFAVTLAGCASMRGTDGWTTLLDGSRADTLRDWTALGDATWRVEAGAVVGEKGTMISQLVHKTPYRDFELRAEFWAEPNTNSGIYIRCTNVKQIDGGNSYEVNIYDRAPNPEFGTGAITRWAKTQPIQKAAGRWNTYVITARGNVITVELNGVQTVRYEDGKFREGPIALQWGTIEKNMPGAPVRFRKIEVKPL